MKKLLAIVTLSAVVSGCAANGTPDYGSAMVIMGAAMSGYANGAAGYPQQNTTQTCTTYPAIGRYGYETTTCWGY